MHAALESKNPTNSQVEPFGVGRGPSRRQSESSYTLKTLTCVLAASTPRSHSLLSLPTPQLCYEFSARVEQSADLIPVAGTLPLT